MTRLNISDETLAPRNVLSQISHAKNHGKSATHIRAEAFSPTAAKSPTFSKAYEKLLAQSNALDFDDLLLRSAKLLRESPAVRERWQQRFQYIHVTNIRTPIAFIRSSSSPAPARNKTSALSATKTNPSTLAWRRCFHSSQLFSAIFPRRHHPSRTQLSLQRQKDLGRGRRRS